MYLNIHRLNYIHITTSCSYRKSYCIICTSIYTCTRRLLFAFDGQQLLQHQTLAKNNNINERSHSVFHMQTLYIQTHITSNGMCLCNVRTVRVKTYSMHHTHIYLLLCTIHFYITYIYSKMNRTASKMLLKTRYVQRICLCVYI